MISHHLTIRAAHLVAVASLFLAVGCATPPYNDAARQGPFFTPTNFSGDPSLPANLRRVMLLPVSGTNVTTPELTAAFDAVFATALQKTNRFEVITLTREECRRRFGVDELYSSAALPRDFMTTLRREFAVDAVLFLDFTAFRGYRPLAIGVRAKLATVEDVRLLWTFDTIFSAADEGVANSARRFYLNENRAGVPADLSPSALQSPSRFGGYVAAATFASLPSVYSPLPIKKRVSVFR